MNQYINPPNPFCFRYAVLAAIDCGSSREECMRGVYERSV
jgi:hypothetical protein